MSTRFVEPARRTYDDAELLYNENRLGTSDHLYGLAAECALKAVLCGLGVIKQDPPEPKLRVHINKLWSEYTSVIMGQGASQLLPGGNGNPFDSWLVDHRYWDDKKFDQERVNRHREGALAALRILENAKFAGVVG